MNYLLDYSAFRGASEDGVNKGLARDVNNSANKHEGDSADEVCDDLSWKKLLGKSYMIA